MSSTTDRPPSGANRGLLHTSEVKSANSHPALGILPSENPFDYWKAAKAANIARHTPHPRLAALAALAVLAAIGLPTTF